jgi:large subunit ribosomal protein L24
MAMHVKKGDMVQIITGDQKGVVQGHNMVLKHVRPSRKNPQGGRIQVEQPVHISNVLPVNPKTSKATRVHYRLESDGTKKRIALDGTEIGVIVKKVQ